MSNEVKRYEPTRNIKKKKLAKSNKEEQWKESPMNMKDTIKL